MWKNKVTNETCPTNIPLTIKELETLMSAEKNVEHLTEMKECTHGELCFEII